MKTIVIIVTFNASRWIHLCIGSLLNSTIPVDILVIDNGSTDGTLEIIKTKFPSVILIELKENIGFGKANNIGLKLVLDKDYQYAFLLNQDAWVESDTIEKMVAVQKRYPEFGVLSPIHISGDERNLDNNFTTYINGYSCPGLISDIIFKRELKEVYEIDFVNAALWLMSRQVLEKVGGFDPLFFMYGEDDDYLDRLKYHGFKVGICPGAFGYHDRSQEMNDVKNWSLERLLSSHILRIKSLKTEPPHKMLFYRALFKSTLKSITDRKDLKKLRLVRIIIQNYNKIIQHRIKCMLPQPSFIDE